MSNIQYNKNVYESKLGKFILKYMQQNDCHDEFSDRAKSIA